MESAELQIHSNDNPTYCSQYKSEVVIFDMVSSEFVCSSCGCVVNDRILHAEDVTRAANASEYSDRTRTDMPESLETHHKGLSTLIGALRH